VDPYTSSFTYFSSCRLSPSGPGSKFSVVWLQGEHDIATKDVLVATIAQAIALNERAVVIDLSEVHFISAATIGVIVDAEHLLAQRGRSLVLRAPPPFVRRIFGVCGLSDLLSRDPLADAMQMMKRAAAVRSWVNVPATGRIDKEGTSVTAKRSRESHVSAAAARELPLFVKVS